MARVDYDAMAGDYDPGRAVSLTSLEPWRGAVAPWLAHEPMVLDLGSGTGIFADAFARWFGIRVIGITHGPELPSFRGRSRHVPHDSAGHDGQDQANSGTW
jgi:ubiquinone/menaquinone biosynthesis C-methylase UbiE